MFFHKFSRASVILYIEIQSKSLVDEGLRLVVLDDPCLCFVLTCVTMALRLFHMILYLNPVRFSLIQRISAVTRYLKFL